MHTTVNSGTRVCPTKPYVLPFISLSYPSVIVMSKTIPIDKYEAVLENGVIKYYAIKGKIKYRMPEAFKDMYTDDYLEIEETTYERPELFNLPDSKTYIPRRTSNV